MKTHQLAEKIVAYLLEHQPATVAAIVLAGVTTSKDAAAGLQYSIRHGVIERERRAGATYSERVQYRLTGRQLPQVSAASGDEVREPSFDALLKVWGIASVPASIPTHAPGRIISSTEYAND